MSECTCNRGWFSIVPPPPCPYHSNEYYQDTNSLMHERDVLIERAEMTAEIELKNKTIERLCSELTKQEAIVDRVRTELANRDVEVGLLEAETERLRDQLDFISARRKDEVLAYETQIRSLIESIANADFMRPLIITISPEDAEQIRNKETK